MRKIEELKKDDCQIFLDKIFDSNVKFNKLNLECQSIDECGIEYVFNDKNGLVPFSDPDLITWLYNNNFDISIPLFQLKVLYAEMNEINSTLFEYAMNVSDISKVKFDGNDILGYIREIEKINNLRKELINKI